MENNDDKIKILYNAVSKDYDIGTEQEFRTKLSDPNKRKAFYDGVGTEYELGSFDDFNLKIDGGIKKKEPTISAASPTGSKTISQSTNGILPAGTIPLPTRLETGQDAIAPPVPFPEYERAPKLSPKQFKTGKENLIKQDLKVIRDNYVQQKNQQYLQEREPNQPILTGAEFEKKLIADETKQKQVKEQKLETERIRNARDLTPEQYAKHEEFKALGNDPLYKPQVEFVQKSFNQKAIRGLETDILDYLRNNPEESAAIGVKQSLEGVELDQAQQAKIIDAVLEPKMKAANENLNWYIQNGAEKAVQQLNTYSEQINLANTKLETARGKVEAMEKNVLKNAKMKDLQAQYETLSKQLKDNQSAVDKVEMLNQLGQAKEAAETEQELAEIDAQAIEILGQPDVQAYIQASQQMQSLKETVAPLLNQLQNNPEYTKAKDELKQAVEAGQKLNGDYQTALSQNGELVSEYTAAYQELSDVYQQRQQAISYLPMVAEIERKQKELAASSQSGSNILKTVSNSVSGAFKGTAAGVPRLLGNIQSTMTGEKATGWGVMADLIEGIGGTSEFFTTDPTSTITPSGDFDFSWKGIVNDLSRNTGFLAAMLLTGKPTYNIAKSGFQRSAKTMLDLQRAEAKAETIAAVLPAGIASYNDYYHQAKEKGMEGAQLLAFAGTGALFEGFSEKIFPEWKLLSKEARKTALSTLKPTSTFKDYIKVLGKGIGGEASEEAAVELFAPINTMLSNLVADEDAKVDTVSMANLQQALLLGGIMGGGISGMTAKGDVRRMREWAAVTLAQSPQEALPAINAMVENGTMTNEQADQLINDIDNYKEVLDVMPEGLSIQKQAAIAPLYNEMKDAEEKANDTSVDETFRQPFKDKVKELNTQIQNILVDEKFDAVFNEEFTREASGIVSEGVELNDETTTEITADSTPAKVEETPEKKVGENAESAENAVVEIEPASEPIAKQPVPAADPELKETKTPVSEKKFARYADTGDGFTASDLMKESDSEATFEINQISPTEAEYSINPDEAAQKTALSNISFYLGKTTDQKGELGGKIYTTKPGKLKLQGNKWVIDTKAEISSEEPKPISEKESVIEEETLADVDQKAGNILPRVAEISETSGVAPENQETFETLAKGNKIVVDKEGRVSDVKQNSGFSSQLYKDLAAVTGDKAEALNAYLDIKNDKGGFKKKFGDWENAVLKDFGRSGKEYKIVKGKVDDNKFIRSTKGPDGNLTLTFNENKLARGRDFEETKKEFAATIKDAETKKLFNETAQKLRDIKLHLIHMALGADAKTSLKEIQRINGIELAKDYYGEPMIFMHAGGEGIKTFNKPGSKEYEANDPLTGSAGIYFSRDVNQAGKYSNIEESKPGKGKDIYYTFLKTRNPYYITDPAAQAKYPLSNSVTLTQKDEQELRKLGYDSVIWDTEGAPKFEVVVFDPSQVEIFATFNKGVVSDGKARPEITPEETEVLNKEAQDMGFDSLYHATSSVNKRLGKDYKDYRDIPKEDLTETAKRRTVTPDEAVNFLKMHNVQSKIDVYTERLDFGLNSEELSRGIKQIQKGDVTKVAAQKVLKKIQDWKRLGYVEVLFGTGGISTRINIPYDISEAVSEMEEEDRRRIESIAATAESNEDFIQNFLEKGDYLDELGNLDLNKVQAAIEDFDSGGYFGDLLELEPNEIQYLKNKISDEKTKQSGTSTDRPDTENKGSGDTGQEKSDPGKIEPPPAEPEAPVEEKEPPKQEERRLTKQIIKSKDVPDRIKDAFTEDIIYYDRLPNDITLAEANAFINATSSIQAAKSVMDFKNSMAFPVRFTVAQILIKRLGAEGEFELLDEVIETIVKKSTELGQGIQALSLFESLTPEGNLKKAKREVAKLIEKQRKRDKKKTTKLDKALRKANEEAIEETIENVKQKIEGVSKIEPKPTVRKKDYGASNKIVTKDKYNELKKQLRGKLFSTPVSPELIQIGVYHLEAGSRKFADFSAELIKDFGKKIRPYLKDLYGKSKEQLIENGYAESEFTSGAEIENMVLEEQFKPVVEKLDKAIAKGNKKEADNAINEIKNIEKETGLYGKYKDLAIKRLKSMTAPSIKQDVESNSYLRDFTDGLVKNIRQQLNLPVSKTVSTAKKDIEIIGDAYKNFEKYKEIWSKTIEDFQKKFAGDEAKMQEMERYFGSLWLSHFSNQMIKSSVKQGLKDLDIKIQDIIRSHYTVFESTKKQLVDKLIGEAGLEGQEAAELALFIEREFKRVATEKKRAALGQIYSSRERKKANIKTLEQTLIEFTNLGGFRYNDIVDLFEQKMGYPKLSEENIKEIIRLSELVQKAPEGLRQQRAIEDLLAYQANIKGVQWWDILTSIWYANILSGYKTQEVNFFANLVNSVLLYTNAAIQNPSQTVNYGLAYLNGIMRGVFEGVSVLQTGYTPIKGKAEILPTLERVRFFGKFNPANALKYVRRFMMATDVLFYEGLKELRAYQLAYKMARADNKLMPSINVKDKAIELFGRNKQVIEDAKNQAELEYEQDIAEINASGTTGYAKTAKINQAKINRKRREYELIERNRNPSIVEQTNTYAAKGTYNYRPEGVIGAFAKVLNRLSEMFPPFRFIVPFTNIIANTFNEALNYTPVGTLRAILKGHISDKISEKTGHQRIGDELTEQEVIDLHVKALMGLAIAVAFYLLSQPGEDDEEPIMQITANGTGDFKKNNELKNTGWQPYSFKVGDRWFSYRETPLLGLFSFLGNMRDYEKYRKEKITDTEWTKWGNAFAMTSTTLLDGTYLKGLDESLGAALDPRNENKMEKFAEGMLRNVKAVAVPNLFTQSYKDFQAMVDEPMKEAGGVLSPLRDIPTVNSIFYDKIDGLGDPVIVDPDRLTSTVRKTGIDKQLWEFISEKKAWITVPNKNTITVYDPAIEKDRVMQPKEYYEFLIQRGGYIKSKLLEPYYGEENTYDRYFDYLKTLPDDEVQDIMKGIKKEATDHARKQTSLLTKAMFEKQQNE